MHSGHWFEKPLWRFRTDNDNKNDDAPTLHNYSKKRWRCTTARSTPRRNVSSSTSWWLRCTASVKQKEYAGPEISLTNKFRPPVQVVRRKKRGREIKRCKSESPNDKEKNDLVRGWLLHRQHKPRPMGLVGAKKETSVRVLRPRNRQLLADYASSMKKLTVFLAMLYSSFVCWWAIVRRLQQQQRRITVCTMTICRCLEEGSPCGCVHWRVI
jgi:hypothetical protein